ncbi:glutamate receptor [Striga asiatica]|uniref:Glutamate receptor n=1 Tax=Striga asiatica TaxID=4170 RepID=A0A5A7RCD8_STRAF|nr:glutamate receptor [Striga asiatica]
MDFRIMSFLLSSFLPFNGVFSAKNDSTAPDVVNIGAIFVLSTINGKVAKIAMNAAVEDVNSDPKFLGGRKLNLSTHDSNYSGFLSIIGGLRFMEMDTVAIIGPQVSGTAHILSHLANELQIPMLSFTALDPTLSSLQYPYFIQTAPNDLYQMSAIAQLISFWGYKEVTAIYTDDDQSRGAMSALGDELSKRRCQISHKTVLSPETLANNSEIITELAKVSMAESRVIVVHSYAVIGLRVLSLAREMNMMSRGYVWIATAWLSTVIESDPGFGDSHSGEMQGIIALRPHTPDSERKRAFSSRWGKLSNGSVGLTTYGFYAYDTVWTVACAVRAFLERGGNISFTRIRPGFSESRKLNLGALSRFDEGSDFLEDILKTDRTGLTSRVAFDPDKSVVRPAFDILNVVGKGYKLVGYWSNYSGLSVLPPEVLYGERANMSSSSQMLGEIVWPGQTTIKPRGWVFPNNGRKLRIGVPDRVSFRAFVSKDENTHEIRGYCVDIFLAAVNLLPYAVPHTFVLFGDKHHNPSYGQLVTMITSNVFDAVVGDIAIVTERTKIVDFTQPYIESGLVVVTPMRKLDSSAWAFMRPFNPLMWAVTGILFLVVGVVVWILEHRINDDFRGPPKKQLITMLWFGFSTMFFAHREKTMSTLGRMVLIIWLFVVLIITSSYTASLTSILTIQHLSPSIQGIDSLISSNGRVGFQVGSFAESYLADELNIARSRLVPLDSPEAYADALDKGRVAAIVDERPYVDLFLSNYCMFQVVGREFTKSGWGFAFPRDSQLATDLSTAILTLSETGKLQELRKKWLSSRSCPQQGSDEDSEQLQLKSFWGLFLTCGVACFLALLVYFCSMVHKFKRYISEPSAPSSRSSISMQIKGFLSFVDEKEEEMKNMLKRKRRVVVSRDPQMGVE